MSKVKGQKPNLNESKGKKFPKGKEKQMQNIKHKQFDEDENDDYEMEEDMEDDVEDEMEDDMDDDMDDDEDDDLELFWKTTINPKKESVLEPPEQFDGIVCITNACFGEHVNKGSRTVVCCKTPLSKESTPICVLNQGVNESERLNLRFGSSATFTLQGQQPSTVHLTGYVQPEEMNDLDFPEDYDMDEEISSKLKQRFGQEDENEEMFPPQPVTKKRKTEAPITQKAAQPKKQPPQKQPPQKKETPNPKTQQKTETPATTQSPQNIETQTKTQPISNQNNNDAKEDTQKTADKPLSKNQQKKLKKLQKKQQQEAKNDNKTNDKTEDTTKETISTPKESEKANETIDDKQESKEQQHEAKDNKTKTKVLSDGIKLPNGIEYKDIKVGSGDEIQNGQTLSLFYVGQLEDKKVFDKVLSGDGFEYHVGSEEPVKGWQLGMKGMKIGGKRRIVVPSKFAFGAQGSAEKSVPANATVTYTIEIKK